MSNENSNSQNSPENKKRSWYWEDKPVSPFGGKCVYDAVTYGMQ